MDVLSKFLPRRFKRTTADESNYDLLVKSPDIEHPRTNPSKIYLFSPIQAWLTPLISSISKSNSFEPTISLPSLPHDATFLRSYAKPLYSGSRLAFLFQWQIGGLVIVSSILCVLSSWGILGSVALLRRIMENEPPSISLILWLFGIYSLLVVLGRAGEQMARIQASRISTLLRSTVFEKSLKLSRKAREEWSLDAIKSLSTEDLPFLEKYFANGIKCAAAPSQWVLAYYQLSGQLGKGPSATGAGTILLLIALKYLLQSLLKRRASMFVNDGTARVLVPSLAGVAAFAWTAHLPVIPSKLTVPVVFTSLILYNIMYESAITFFPGVKRVLSFWPYAGRVQDFLMAEENTSENTLTADTDHEEDKFIGQDIISSVDQDKVGTMYEKFSTQLTLYFENLKRLGIYRILAIIICFLALVTLQTLSSYVWLHPFLFLIPSRFVIYYAILSVSQLSPIIVIGYIITRNLHLIFKDSLNEVTPGPKFSSSISSILTALAALLASTFIFSATAPLLLVVVIPTAVMIPYFISRYRTAAREFRRTHSSFCSSTTRELEHTLKTHLTATDITLSLDEREDIMQNYNSLLDREHAASILKISLNTWFAFRAEIISIILVLCSGLLAHFGWLILGGKGIALYAAFIFSGYIRLAGQSILQVDEEVDKSTKEEAGGTVDGEEQSHMLHTVSIDGDEV